MNSWPTHQSPTQCYGTGTATFWLSGNGTGAGSGFVPLTNGSGSGRPKNKRIRIPNTAFCLWKLIQMLLQKVISKKLPPWRSLTKIAGSGAGPESRSVWQRCGSGSVAKCYGSSATLPDPKHRFWLKNIHEVTVWIRKIPGNHLECVQVDPAGPAVAGTAPGGR